MQNLAKRQWGNSLTLKESADIMIDSCIKAREKNILIKKPAQICYSYVIEGSVPLQYMHNIGSAFKYSQKDMPYSDYTKDSLLRLLSIALKTHFFLFQESNLAYEPYYFPIVSLDSNTHTSFGLIYAIEKENKTIIVSDKNLSYLFDNKLIITEFNNVVIEDSFKWYHMKNWNKIKLSHNLDCNLNSFLALKKKNQEYKEISKKEDLEKLVYILDVPFELKDKVKPLGLEWNNKVKTWYLPKNFDLDSVLELIKNEKLQIK